ncbi:hypothetical protein [Acidicapsa ligni]|uniref:hypothetical protein n=1 Tax=Acidicapsa ligni TaxID=542300 RepID=UPI0021DF83F8|nr:hypothetical protein [Acidicapsa ligni]
MSLETAFLTVYGREAKPEETNRFNRLAKELGIRENDAIWSIVFLLGHHLELTEKLPERMGEQANRTLAKFDVGIRQRSETAETELRAIKARIEEAISSTVVTSCEREIARSAQTVARYAAAKNWLQWLGVASCVGMVLLATAFCWGYENGKRVGYAYSIDVKEASSWAATPVGQGAYRLDRNGDLVHLLRCDQMGWKVQKTRTGAKGCFVNPGPDGEITGWLIP